MINRIIHQIWFGNINNISEQNLYCINTTKEIYNNFEYFLWTEDLLKKYNFFNDNEFEWIYKNIKKLIKNVEKESHYTTILSDIVRYKVLYDYGGIYFDIDVEQLKQIDEKLLNEYDILLCGVPGGAGGKDGLEVSALFSKQYSKLYEYEYKCLLKNIHEFHEDYTGKIFVPFRYAGPGFFTFRYNEIKNKLNEKILQLPTEYYYPYTWDEEDVNKYNNIHSFPNKNVYGIHRWSGSWK